MHTYRWRHGNRAHQAYFTKKKFLFRHIWYIYYQMFEGKNYFKEMSDSPYCHDAIEYYEIFVFYYEKLTKMYHKFCTRFYMCMVLKLDHQNSDMLSIVSSIVNRIY